ncbi:MAG: hypothetical protein LCH74_20335 [Proteobacteria bacterium]|nr:hypothetical protein [Pseudomonadota bacterium]
MNGGLSQDYRILRLVDDEYRAGDHQRDIEAFNRASHSDALRELQLVPAEDWQVEDRPPTPREVLSTVGWERIAIAAIFATVVWCSAAAFAVAFGGPR